MKKLLFNINSSNWFGTVSGRVISIEVFLILMTVCFTIAFNVVAYESKYGLDYSWRSSIAGIVIFLIMVQFVVFSRSKSVSKEIEDSFWKTQLWRFRDPRYAMQEMRYNEKYNYFPGQRDRELDGQWEAEYNETPDESYAKRFKFIQTFRWWIGIGLIVGTTLITYYI